MQPALLGWSLRASLRSCGVLYRGSRNDFSHGNESTLDTMKLPFFSSARRNILSKCCTTVESFIDYLPLWSHTCGIIHSDWTDEVVMSRFRSYSSSSWPSHGRRRSIPREIRQLELVYEHLIRRVGQAHKIHRNLFPIIGKRPADASFTPRWRQAEVLPLRCSTSGVDCIDTRVMWLIWLQLELSLSGGNYVVIFSNKMDVDYQNGQVDIIF